MRTEPATQVLVVVYTDLTVGEEIDGLEVRVSAPDELGDDQPPMRAYSLSATQAPGRHTLPLSFSIAPKAPGSREDFRVVVSGLREGETVVEQQAVASFVPDRSLVLELFLSRGCLERLCRDGEGRRTERACDAVSVECHVVEPSEALTPWQGPGSELTTEVHAVQDGDAGGGEPAESDAGQDDALGAAGMSCATEPQQALACEGHASRRVLRCDEHGEWELFDVCPEATRCNTARGLEQGTCVSVPPVCTGQAPGDVCDGTARKTCGPDLVTLTDNPCQANAHCDAAQAARCVCSAGYELDERGRCINPDDCPEGACAHGTCVDGLGMYSCACGAGYAGTSTQSCRKVDYCPKDACVPGGTCVDQPSWSCECGTGFAGTGSQACVDIDDCPANACNGHGVCKDGFQTFSCACNPGFSGEHCANDVCTPNPCRNGGVCSRTGTLCGCGEGFSGVNCQVEACAQCQARASVCDASGSAPAITSYLPVCDGASCVSGGVAQAPVACTARSDTSCAVAGQTVQLTSYVPACDATDRTRCLSGGRPLATNCPSASAKCELESASGRWVASTYAPACESVSRCIATGRETRFFCDELPTTCNGSSVIDYTNGCDGVSCAATSAACVQRTTSVCDATRASYEVRNYSAACAGGQCSYTSNAVTCSIPFCQTVAGTEMSCGGCGDASGTASCRSATTCDPCSNGCSAATGLCARRPGINPPDCSKPGACT